MIVSALTGLLAIVWLRSGRSLASLGLSAPLRPGALVELGIAAFVLVALAVAIIGRPCPQIMSAEEDSSQKLMPRTRAEMAVFVAFSLVVGCGWELLYRGYLLWCLPTRLPLFISIIVAAGAYGIAHGVRNARVLMGSLVAAVLFTLAYAIAENLWWLMLLHSGLPLLGVLAFHRRRRQSAYANTDPAAPVPSLRA